MLLLIMGGMFLGVRSARASDPSMDYWFIETLTFGAVELPEGVVIRTSDPTTLPRGYLMLENQTKTMLYVLSLSYKGVLVMKTPDPNWKARVNGAHEVASYLVAPDRPAYLNMEALTDLDQDLEDRNVLTLDPPADNVTIPAAQSSELLLVYGGQVIVVPFTISYALNTNFANSPEAYQNQMANAQVADDASASATQQANASAVLMAKNNLMIMGLFGVAGIFLIGWLVWRGVTRSKN
jgi:hypothetical protein